MGQDQTTAGKTSAATSDFAELFEQLTGHPPFPWQECLFNQLREGTLPSRCDIPTGLGKTSVIACWLIAREFNSNLPRRLIYVVNRRTVVDQTTTEVENIRENLVKIGKSKTDLAISTLRGQYADNREWYSDPSKPAVICGTVDMIGSRLLFSGYGIGRNSKPLHAGFLGQDTLIVHDEAHLEPAFQQLLLAIQNEQTNGRFKDKYPLRVMELSATSRTATNDKPFELTPAEKSATKESPGVLAEVGKRLRAHKTLGFHPIEDEKKQLADEVARLALDHEKEPGRAILVFVRTVDDLAKVVAKLPKDRTRQLTGTMRGLEREALLTDSIFARFLPKPPDTATPGTVYLVCTSAGEVGVNISADHLVCDLSTYESMAQRFGRVNRFGLCEDTRIDIVHPSSFADAKKLVAHPKVIEALQKTLALLKSPVLNNSASPHALSQLEATERAAAFAPTPEFLPTTDILFDAWSMTSITGKLPGRPPVEPYLHGIAAWEPPQTKVAWREEVAVITGDLLDEYQPAELLEAYPLQPHELLTDRSDRIYNTLKKLSPDSDVPLWIIDEDDKAQVTTLAQVVAGDKEAIYGTTLLLPPMAGGLDKGFFTATAKYDEKLSDDYDVADRWESPAGWMRHRKWQTPEQQLPKPPTGMKLVRQIALTPPNAEEDAEPVKTWHWFVRITAAEADARSRVPYDLLPHLDDAKHAATQFVRGLLLDDELRRVVILACEFHDLGKERERWQRAIGNANYGDANFPEAKAWAKSGKRRNRLERSSYRHEFGSILDVQSRSEFLALSDDGQDLLLHLIAAHHGRARPHFTAEESFDDNHPDETAWKLSIETPRRFSRLQRKYGRWGLAYLESLVRVSDYAASKKADQVSK